MYTADQGFGLGEHGFNQKVAPYDSTVASPLIIRHAGKLPEGKVCRHPVNGPDLVQLFCDTAGVTVPWKMHGRDIRPLLQNPESDRMGFTDVDDAHRSFLRQRHRQDSDRRIVDRDIRCSVVRVAARRPLQVRSHLRRRRNGRDL